MQIFRFAQNDGLSRKRREESRTALKTPQSTAILPAGGTSAPQPSHAASSWPAQQFERVIATPSLVDREIDPKHGDRLKPTGIS